MSDCWPIPVPQTKCPRAKNGKHRWTNKAHLYPDFETGKINFKAKDEGYIIPHLLWCINCKIEHQP